MGGKNHEFEAVLQRLMGEHLDISQEAEEIMVSYLSSKHLLYWIVKIMITNIFY